MARMIHFWLLIGLFAALPHSAWAQTPPPTLEAYEQTVREAYAAATRSDRIGLDAASERLIAAREVALPDGATIPANNTWLAEAVAAEPPDYRLIAERLGAILDAAGQIQSAQDPTAQQKLADVFARPPFKSREAPSAWTNFWRGVGNTIEDFFEWLARSLPSGGGSSLPSSTPSAFGSLSPTAWVLLIVGVLLLLALVIYAIRSVRQSLVRDAKAQAAAVDNEEKLSANEALDRAHTQARSGDYRTAVRYLYLSSLLWLDERKLLRYDRSLTNREYLLQTQDNTGLQARLAPVVNTFDRVWYGHTTLGEEDFRAYEEQVNGLRDVEQKP